MTNRITEVTRRDIFDALDQSNIQWFGRLDDIAFLSRIYDLDLLPSNDTRFRTAAEDIGRHRFLNDDWEANWVYFDNRFQLLSAEDGTFLRFVVEMLHPAVRASGEEVEQIRDMINEHLREDGVEIVPQGQMSGRPLHIVQAADQAGRTEGGPKRPRRREKASRQQYYALDHRPIGEGGQAQVYPATDKATGEVVALKRLLHPNDDSTARMKREIEVMRSVSHLNIMPCIRASNRHLWFSMPLATRTLRDVGRTLSDEDLVRTVRACLGAMACAHEAGFLHRDIKPSNILELPGDSDHKARWVLADWGLVRRPLGETSVPRTRTGMMLGSEEFAAPEMWRDAHRADHRADYYSTGRVVAWARGCDLVPNVRALPDGLWRAFVRTTTADSPDDRPASIAGMEALVDAVLGPSQALPQDELPALEEQIRQGNSAAVARVIELARLHPENTDLALDGIPRIRGSTLRDLLAGSPGTVGEFVEAVSKALAKDDAWGSRDFNYGNHVLGWLQDVAALALSVGNHSLADDAAEALFRQEPIWERFSQRRRTRRWLESVEGQSARTVADALRRHPDAVLWLLKEDWRPTGCDPRITAVLSLGEQPHDPSSPTDLSAPGAVYVPTDRDHDWVNRHHVEAAQWLEGQNAVGSWEGISIPQMPGNWDRSALRNAVASAQIRDTGWPIGVGARDDAAPSNDGVSCRMSIRSHHDYWAVDQEGRFISVRNLDQFQDDPEVFWFQEPIWNAAHLVLFAQRLYTALDCSEASQFSIVCNYSGLQDRRLVSSDGRRSISEGYVSKVNEVRSSALLTLGRAEEEFLDLVDRLSSPVLEMFGFLRLEDEVRNEIAQTYRARIGA